MRRISVIFTFLLLFGILIFPAAGQVNSGEIPVSPALAALQKELKAENRSALEDFWQEVTKKGAPLVEPVPGESEYVWLTFLWQDKGNTENVVIWSDLGDWGNLDSLRMIRLSGTNVWYKTYRVRNDARFAYRLTVNDSLQPFGSEARGKKKNVFIADPLNPHQYDFFKPTIYSVVEFPSAPSLELTKRNPEIPKGQVERTNFSSKVLRNDHRIWVYTPPAYKAKGKPYELLLLFDGSGYVSLIPAPIVLDNLLAKNKIPPTVAVMVDSGGGEARDRELACNPQFAEFIVKELLPWVHKNYNVTSDPKSTIVGGASFGGLAAACAAFKYPEIFGNVLSQAGSYWWRPEGDDEYEWLTRQFAAGPKLPIRFYFEIGRLENLSRARPDSPTNLIANRHFRDVLKAKGYTVRFDEINGGHDFFPWQATFADGLIFLTNDGKEKNKK